MAGHLIRGFAALAALSGIPAVLLAEPALLADPTRPPSAAQMEAGVFGDAGSSRLSSIVLPKQGRASAVIDGQVVRVGERVGEATLRRVTETEAVLEGPEGIERLYLIPNVDKKMNATKAAVRRNKKE